VDIADPRHLTWPYAQRLADVVDSIGEPGAPIRVLHLGGGALTLPRYVAATRPGSAQLVVDRDAALLAFVQRTLPLPADPGLVVRIGDARDALASADPQHYDLVITDVFDGQQQVPARFTSVEFATEVARVIRPDGRYAVNIADSPSLAFARTQVATLRAVFADVCLVTQRDMPRAGYFGNVVLVGANTPLPVQSLMGTVRLLHGEDLDRFAANAQPVTDATAVDSPAPPSPPVGWSDDRFAE
jgi:spermidine synthase